MVTLNTTTKVLIIGTGLSGVALAQILRKANINFEIFERDDGTRKQGWGVGLDEFVCLWDSKTDKLILGADALRLSSHFSLTI